MANPRIKAIKIDNTGVYKPKPRIKAIKIDNTGVYKPKPRIKAIKIQTDKQYNSVIYQGNFYQGVIK